MGRAESGAIEFRLLGPIEVARNGDTLSLGGPRQRALLGLLLLEPGRPVSVDRLVDELWHGQPPAGAATTLRAYVSKLQTVLGEDAVITSGASGYALDVLADRVDSARFERLTRDGHAALERGAVRGAAERLRAALDLWRGRAFAGVGDEGALRLEADRLAELRLFALEERLEADLALGHDEELVDELEALVRDFPYREPANLHKGFSGAPRPHLQDPATVAILGVPGVRAADYRYSWPANPSAKGVLGSSTKEWWVEGTVFVAPDRGRAQKLFGLGKPLRTAFFGDVPGDPRAHATVSLPSYGEEQTAVFVRRARCCGPQAIVLVRKGAVVWQMRIGTIQRTWNPARAQVLAELKKYALKQRARVGTG